MIVAYVIPGLVASGTALEVDDFGDDTVLVTDHLLYDRPNAGFLKTEHKAPYSPFQRRPDRVGESSFQDSLGIALCP